MAGWKMPLHMMNFELTIFFVKISYFIGFWVEDALTHDEL